MLYKKSARLIWFIQYVQAFYQLLHAHFSNCKNWAQKFTNLQTYESLYARDGRLIVNRQTPKFIEPFSGYIILW